MEKFKSSPKLVAYSAMAAALASVHETLDAQVVITDIYPNIFVECEWLSEDLLLDIDADGEMDIKIWASSYEFAMYSPNLASAGIDLLTDFLVVKTTVPPFTLYNTYYSLTCEFASHECIKALPEGVLLNDNDTLSWEVEEFIFSQDQCGMYGDIGAIGLDWPGTNHFLALKSGDNYGWIRMRGNLFSGLYVDAYAYGYSEDDSVITSLAEGIFPDSISNLLLSAEEESLDTDGYNLTFNRSADESKVSAYRVMLVRDNDYLNVLEASLVNEENYIDIEPTSSDTYSLTFPPSFKDAFNESINPVKRYKAYVMCMPNNPYSTDKYLNPPSNKEKLYTPTTIGTVSNIILEDVGDDVNAHDLQVSFTKAEDESEVLNYVIFIVKPEDTATFYPGDLLALVPYTYYVVLDNGEDKIVRLTEFVKDWKGNEIIPGVEYVAYVVTHPNLDSELDYSIAGPSNTVILDIPDFTQENIENTIHMNYTNQQIEIHCDGIAGFEIYIYDVTGKCVQFENVRGNSTLLPIQLTPGYYFIKITTNDFNYVEKLKIN